jgi:hypothetical protein
MRVIMSLLACAALAACTTRAVPQERTYVDRRDQVFDLVGEAVSSLKGHVLHADRRAGTITAAFPADVAGQELYLDARIERHMDETVVGATVHGGRQQVDEEIIELYRSRFFEELDALAASVLPGVLVSPTRGPVPWSTPRM